MKITVSLGIRIMYKSNVLIPCSILFSVYPSLSHGSILKQSPNFNVSLSDYDINQEMHREYKKIITYYDK